MSSAPARSRKVQFTLLRGCDHVFDHFIPIAAMLSSLQLPDQQQCSPWQPLEVYYTCDKHLTAASSRPHQLFANLTGQASGRRLSSLTSEQTAAMRSTICPFFTRISCWLPILSSSSANSLQLFSWVMIMSASFLQADM